MRGPETMKELALSSAASGTLLFVVLLGIAVWNRRAVAPPAGDPAGGLGLLFPVPAVSRAAMSDGFGESRGQGTRTP